MDIEGLGESMVSQLVESGLVKEIPAIYHLEKSALLELERMGEKSAGNLVEAIAGSKNRTLWRLLFGLGILHVGAVAARKLAARFGTMERLASASVEELQAVDDVGEIMALSIRRWFDNPKVRELVDSLRQAGVNMNETDAAVPVESGPLKGTTWVLTGTLGMPRDDAAELIRKAGGTVTSSVSKKTTHLLAGESAGSKLEKATKLGIPILDEAAFLELISADLKTE
jgi:DNA ligase (NAD+)